jgi:anti-sigma B factor antagonist
MTDEGNELLKVTPTDAGFDLTGEIDGHSSPQLEAVLADVADRHIAIDMSGIEFVDSSGLRVLVEAHQRAEEAGGSLTLIEISQPVARLLELSGMNGYLRVKPAAG